MDDKIITETSFSFRGSDLDVNIHEFAKRLRDTADVIDRLTTTKLTTIGFWEENIAVELDSASANPFYLLGKIRVGDFISDGSLLIGGRIHTADKTYVEILDNEMLDALLKHPNATVRQLLMWGSLVAHIKGYRDLHPRGYKKRLSQLQNILTELAAEIVATDEETRK